MEEQRLGVDIGGTFTDIVFLAGDGSVRVRKIASTPHDFSEAVLEGSKLGMEEAGLTTDSISEVSHGFTVATNAILEGTGVRTALITTEGFKDVLELSRIRTPRLYDLYYKKPSPLVERKLRFGVKERVTFQGEIRIPLDMSDVETVLEQIVSEGVKSVAISLLHSYANSKHEEMIADFIRKKAPDITLSVSSELLPEMREYERTSTAVINAYVRPTVESYLTHLGEEFANRGVTVPIKVMQSNGGLSTVESAAEKPMYCIESGPAAGVVGAFHLGKKLGVLNVMTLDMGGTTAKASIIEDNELLLAPEYEVGGGMSIGHRLLKGSGYILRVPSIDIAEVGAGGGSIAWVDQGGSLQVGPSSSGAVPGPVCYMKGGTEPTVTDANVSLGYLNPEYLLGGAFPIDSEAAKRALVDRIGIPLGLSEMEAAHGVHMVANSNMGRALRSVSSERGRDPRKFTLVAFGGGGPIHASGLADMLGVSKIIIPPFPGVFSAFGLLFADVEHHFVRTYFKSFNELDLNAANGILTDLLESGKGLLTEEGFDKDRQQIVTQIDMKYVGQTTELTVNHSITEFSKTSLESLGEAFEKEHEKTYGYRANGDFQLVNIRVIARGLAIQNRVPDQIQLMTTSGGDLGERQVYFGKDIGWVQTPLTSRQSLDTSAQDGPLVIEEYDSTTIVPPGWTAKIDQLKNILVEKR